jgi:hypothetical protein
MPRSGCSSRVKEISGIHAVWSGAGGVSVTEVGFRRVPRLAATRERTTMRPAARRERTTIN